jgi:WD40 repeat protein
MFASRHTIPGGEDSAAGSNIASGGSQDKTVILWDVKTGQQIGEPLSRHWDVVRSVAFSPDGKMLASGSEDHTILLWDVQTHLQVGQPLSEHSDLVLSIAFSPDGKTLASGSQDKNIIVWDVETHKPIGQPLRGHIDLVASVVFSPDGKTLASGSQDIFLWDLHPPSWIEKSCQCAGRNFTLTEWENYFPKEHYRKTCPQFELEPAPTPTAVPAATPQ